MVGFRPAEMHWKIGISGAARTLISCRYRHENYAFPGRFRYVRLTR